MGVFRQVLTSKMLPAYSTGAPIRITGSRGLPHFKMPWTGASKLIDVGPLATPLSRQADIHLRIRPGTSGALALGMANVIIEEGLYDREFVENWTLGFDEYRSYVRTFTPTVTEEYHGGTGQ